MEKKFTNSGPFRESTSKHSIYTPKLYITENGASYSDGPDAEGRVRDQRRLSYLRGHFTAV